MHLPHPGNRTVPSNLTYTFAPSFRQSASLPAHLETQRSAILQHAACSVLSRLASPCRYIVQFYGCGWSQEAEEGVHVTLGHQLFFLQEYMEGGTLHQMVLKAMTSKVWPRTCYSC
jgi:hypothetical protein